MRRLFRFIKKIFVLLALIAVVKLGFSLLSNTKKVGLVYHENSNLSINNYSNIAYEFGAEIIEIDSNYMESSQINEIIDQVDGLIFAGGKDFDPSLYGGDSYDLIEDYNVEEDRADLKILEIATQKNKPILGICRGFQLINIYYGGSLYEDLPSQFSNKVKHRSGKDNFSYHSLTIGQNSRLASYLEGENIQEVNSMHHQGIKSLAEGLEVTATSQDGLVEAFENPYYQAYMMGVQWHPETSFDSGNYLSRIIFEDYFRSLGP